LDQVYLRPFFNNIGLRVTIRSAYVTEEGGDLSSCARLGDGLNGVHGGLEWSDATC